MGCYAHIVFICWILSLFIICYGIFIKDIFPNLFSFIYKDSANFWIFSGLIIYFVYPFILEGIYNLIAWINEDKYIVYHTHDAYRDKSGIIYSPDYNITFCGLEKCHPFDSKKYERCFEFLQAQHVIAPTTRIHNPDVCPRSLLLDLNKFYLLSHCYTLFICAYLEVPLIFIPACLYRYRVLEPMLRGTMGTIEGCCIAIEKGWAINLSGGYHHATKSFGGGFCVYPDIYLAIIHMRRWHQNIKKIMIIDLDAHQGNGHERDFMDDDNIYTLDCYNPHIYPGDDYAKQKINLNVPAYSSENTENYITKLDESLKTAFIAFNEVNFILYNAGTDILEGDPLGQLHVSEEGVIRRDEMVFRAAFEKNIPILMVLSGGYQMINAQVIANSIQNLFDKFPQMNRGREI